VFRGLRPVGMWADQLRKKPPILFFGPKSPLTPHAGIGLRWWAWPHGQVWGYKTRIKHRPVDLVGPVEGSVKWAAWTHY
jgi:hypothetical protein